ncbi:unnamed protein product, partial [Ixodes persulcatus]
CRLGRCGARPLNRAPHQGDAALPNPRATSNVRARSMARRRPIDERDGSAGTGGVLPAGARNACQRPGSREAHPQGLGEGQGPPEEKDLVTGAKGGRNLSRTERPLRGRPEESRRARLPRTAPTTAAASTLLRRRLQKQLVLLPATLCSLTAADDDQHRHHFEIRI